MAPGFLLYLNGSELMARPFDADRLEFTGEPISVADDIAIQGGISAFYASNAGSLVYQTRAGGFGRQLLWMDRNGKPVPPSGQSANTTHVRLSPDGGRIAYPLGEVNRDADIWIHDIERNVPTRVTSQTGGKRYPVWSPDGSRLAFGSNQGIPRAWSLREKASNGTGEEKVLLNAEPGFAVLPDDWSGDGRYIVFEKYKDGTEGRGVSSRQGSTGSLWILPMKGDSKPITYLADKFDHGHAALSPNGRWLAYTSNESGSYQVFVQSFPNPSEGKWQISTEGGMAPHWKRDGSEIYYLDTNRRIVMVPVAAGNSFAAKKPEPLFTTAISFPLYPNFIPYDVAPDGQRFLLSSPTFDPALARLKVVMNWTNAQDHKKYFQ
jgi:dipeptidyl aminopeptidase/acylaminoacyl peptidase